MWLRENYNIEVEMSDLYNILCYNYPGDSEEEANILVSALNSFSEERALLAAED